MVDFSHPPPPHENRAVYDEVMWKNAVERYATDDNMPHAHCMLDTYGYKYSEYVMHIASPLQQWLNERASMLR